MLKSESFSALVFSVTWAFCRNIAAINSVGCGACAASTVAVIGGAGAGHGFL